MRFVTMQLSFLLALLVPTSVRSAPAEDANIYLLRITCGPRVHYQTGFRVQGFKGIITSLHGVIGCKKTEALGSGSDNSYQDLKIRLVDTRKDLALLSNQVLDEAVASGLEASTNITRTLTVVGHPHGIAAQLRSSLTLRTPATVTLQYLVPVATLVALRPRKNPDVDSEVLSIEGHLTLGHSGSPILNTSGKVVAVANGGLQDGAIEISWAIPLKNSDLLKAFDWSTPQTAQTDLDHILLFEARDVFALAEGNVGALPSASCLGLTLDPIKLLGLGELLTTIDDHATAQQLATMYQVDRDPAVFVVYRDPAARLTLVIPTGWVLKTTGGRCVAASPDPEVSILFEKIAVPPGAGRLKIASDMAGDKEYADFCSRGYITDPWMSNWRGIAQPERGVMLQRKSYSLIDSRCGMPGLLPAITTSPIWASAFRPQGWPRGPYQCNIGLCPPPQVVYPAWWAAAQMPPPPDLVRAIGFANYVVSEDTLLTMTMMMTASNSLVAVQTCISELSSTPTCRTEYARRKAWGLGVLAAAASTIETH